MPDTFPVEAGTRSSAPSLSWGLDSLSEFQQETSEQVCPDLWCSFFRQTDELELEARRRGRT